MNNCSNCNGGDRVSVTTANSLCSGGGGGGSGSGNSAGGTPSSGQNVRSSYHQKALQQIRSSLQPFATVFSSSSLQSPPQPQSTSSTSSSPLPPSNNQPPPPPYSYYHALLQQQSSSQSPSPQTLLPHQLYNYNQRCDSQPPSPPPPPPPQRDSQTSAALHYYQNNGYFTPHPQSTHSNYTADTSSTTSSNDYYYTPKSSGTLTPTTSSQQSQRQSPSSQNVLGSQLPPPPVSRQGGIEYRAQQYPFVPSQVPMNVQQLLGRIHLTTGNPSNAPSRNNSPPNVNIIDHNQQRNNTRYALPPRQVSTTPPLPPPQQPTTPSPTSQLQYKLNSTVSKKPTLIIKSTVVPKPVLQTATTLDQKNSNTGRPPPHPMNGQYLNITPPPPPYNNDLNRKNNNTVPLASSSPPPPPLPPKPSKKNSLNSSAQNVSSGREEEVSRPSGGERSNERVGGQQNTSQTQGGPPQQQQNGNEIIHTHESPIPERKKLSKEKEEERFESKVRVYSPAAFKFFMEQHVENVIKSHQERLHRRLQLESEMAKIGLSEEAQTQMRKMLSQKESNYIRLKRAKMDKSMFKVIRTIGVGAFGEVALVRKIDTQLLYAMKTLRKSDVLRRNQVAHVKAERDILAEADNEWVVKLYYSFQDKDHLYFVMDYIPGGDLMSLLIKEGIFEEPLAQFYIAELTCAIESVHKMGFIHRDIKPDNILIDRDGHIKLTDFGLCTGFRWTHNSRYYQDTTRTCVYCTENICNEHPRQNNPERERGPKVLEKRRMMMNKNKDSNVRCLAHSLVGTPNYIAPEVLLRTGYTQLCDWWSVGVILYEMVVGQPPFHADKPADTQFKVINWEKTLRFPAGVHVSPQARDLILKLCTDHSRRLGKNGAQEIKNHPFLYPIFHPNSQTINPPPPPPDYSDISSISSSISSNTTTSCSSTNTYSSTSSSSTPQSIYSSSSSTTPQQESPPINIRRTIAPYIPKIAHPTDTSNFDPCEEEATDHRLNFDDDYGGDNQFHGFFEFTFRRFFDDCYHLEDLRREAAEKEKEGKEEMKKKGAGSGQRTAGGNSNGGPVYV